MYFPLHNAWVFLSAFLGLLLRRGVGNQAVFVLLNLFRPKPQPPEPSFYKPLSWTDFSTSKSYGNRAHDPYVDPKNFNYQEPDFPSSPQFQPDGQKNWFLGNHWQDLLTRGLFFSMPHGKNRNNLIFKDLNAPFNHAIAQAIVASDKEKTMQQTEQTKLPSATRPMTFTAAILLPLLALFLYMSPATTTTTVAVPAVTVQQPDVTVLALQKAINDQTIEIAKLRLELAQQQQAGQAEQADAIRELTGMVKDMQRQRYRKRK